MNNSLPLLVLLFFLALLAIAYWRLVLLLVTAAFLSIMAVGVINIASWFQALS